MEFVVIDVAAGLAPHRTAEAVTLVGAASTLVERPLHLTRAAELATIVEAGCVLVVREHLTWTAEPATRVATFVIVVELA